MTNINININFLSINFTNVIQDSNVHTLVSRMKSIYTEFGEYTEFCVTGDQLKIKALDLSSAVKSLCESVNEVRHDNKRDFIKTILESSFVVIEKFKEAQLSLDLDEKITTSLLNFISDFFEQTLGRCINEEFWFDLKCYEWFKKENHS